MGIRMPWFLWVIPVWYTWRNVWSIPCGQPFWAKSIGLQSSSTRPGIAAGGLTQFVDQIRTIRWDGGRGLHEQGVTAAVAGRLSPRRHPARDRS